MTQKEVIESFLFDIRRRRETPQREGLEVFESNSGRVEAEIRDLRSFLLHPFSTKNQPQRGFYKFTEIIVADECAQSIPHPDISIRIPPTVLDGTSQHQNGDLQIILGNKTLALVDFTLRPAERIESHEYSFHPTLQVPVIPQSSPARPFSAFDRELEFPKYVRQVGRYLPKENYHPFMGMGKRQRNLAQQIWRTELLSTTVDYLDHIDSTQFPDTETEEQIIENLITMEQILSG